MPKCGAEMRWMMTEKIKDIVQTAGNMIVKPQKLSVMGKEGHANYVTNMDIEVEEYLKAQLTQMLPGSIFIGEEQKNQELDDRLTWIVDPIDGTTNFCRGWAFSAVSVALLENKMPVLGCIYQPFKKEMFWAEKGKGAYLNGERIRVSDVDFPQALVGVGTSPYQEELAGKGMELALAFLQHAGDLRILGSAALDLAYVACGRQDIFFELRLSPWDVAAGALLVEEAGGVFQMPLCGEVQFEKPAAVLAANGNCIEQAASLFKEIAGKAV